MDCALGWLLDIISIDQKKLPTEERSIGSEFLDSVIDQLFCCSSLSPVPWLSSGEIAVFCTRISTPLAIESTMY